MARYKVISEKGAYLPVGDEVVRLELGADSKAARAYGVRAQVCRLFEEGEELEFSGIPGPHLEPLDAEAKERMAAYWAKFPGATLDPTRSLPLGQDPMVRPTFDQAMLRVLERMEAEPETARVPVAPSAVDGQIAALTEAVAKLAGIVGQLAATPPPSGRKAA